MRHLRFFNAKLVPFPGGVMERLLNIGFERVGTWTLQSGALVLQLERMEFSENVLYAFAVGAEVKYIGKAIQPLKASLMGYVRPAPTQPTNLRNHSNLKRTLHADRQTVEIFALPDNGLMRYGEFQLNLAARLEDSLIASLKPEWNGQRCVPLAAFEREIKNGQLGLLAAEPIPSPGAPSADRQVAAGMKMDLFGELKRRTGKTFVTLGHRNPFDLVSVDSTCIVVRPASTETVRAIPYKQIQAAFDHLRENGVINLQGIRSYSEMNPVYVAALFADFPGVTVSTRPIILHFLQLKGRQGMLQTGDRYGVDLPCFPLPEQCNECATLFVAPLSGLFRFNASQRHGGLPAFD